MATGLFRMCLDRQRTRKTRMNIARILVTKATNKVLFCDLEEFMGTYRVNATYVRNIKGVSLIANVGGPWRSRFSDYEFWLASKETMGK